MVPHTVLRSRHGLAWRGALLPGLPAWM